MQQKARESTILSGGLVYDAAKLASLKAHDPDFTTCTAGSEYLPTRQREPEVNKNILPNPANWFFKVEIPALFIVVGRNFYLFCQ